MLFPMFIKSLIWRGDCPRFDSSIYVYRIIIVSGVSNYPENNIVVGVISDATVVEGCVDMMRTSFAEGEDNANMTTSPIFDEALPPLILSFLREISQLRLA